MPARAVEQAWYGSANNNWWNPANWFGIALPVPTDTVFFGHDPLILRSTVNLDANATVAGLTLNSHPPFIDYLFQRTGNSVLTVTGDSVFRNTVNAFANHVTLSGFHLTTQSLHTNALAFVSLENNARVIVNGRHQLGAERHQRLARTSWRFVSRH